MAESQTTNSGTDQTASRNVLERPNARRVALSLKRTVERRSSHCVPPYQSAVLLLNYYIDQAGSGLSDKQREVLLDAKSELRRVFR